MTDTLATLTAQLSALATDEAVALHALAFLYNAHANGDTQAVHNALTALADNDALDIDTDDATTLRNATRSALWGAFVGGAFTHESDAQ